MAIQQDVEREIISLLGEALGSPDRVSYTLPQRWSPKKGVHVTVQSDGTPITGKGWTRETIRVSVHGERKQQVGSFMRRIDSYMLSSRQDHFLSIKPGVGVFVAPDSKVGGFIASATYGVAKPRLMY